MSKPFAPALSVEARIAAIQSEAEQAQKEDRWFLRGIVWTCVVVVILVAGGLYIEGGRTEAPPGIVYRVTQWTSDGTPRTWHSHHIDLGFPTVTLRNAEHPNLMVYLYPNMRVEEVTNVP